MVDFLFTLGQAAAVLVLVYGGTLVLLPYRPRERDEMRAMHLSTHA